MHSTVKNLKISSRLIFLLIVVGIFITISIYIIYGICCKQHEEAVENTTSNKNLLKLQEIEHRKTRESRLSTVSDLQNETAKQSSNGYYEEQRPVVVHAESILPIMSYRQSTIGPPKIDFNDIDPFYADDNGEEEQQNNASEDISDEVNPYYQRGDDAQAYYDSDEDSYKSYERYNEGEPDDRGKEQEDEGEDQRDTTNQQKAEGRSGLNPEYDSYYRQWFYATPSPNAGQVNTHSENYMMYDHDNSEGNNESSHRELQQPMIVAVDQRRNQYRTYDADMNDHNYAMQQQRGQQQLQPPTIQTQQQLQLGQQQQQQQQQKQQMGQYYSSSNGRIYTEQQRRRLQQQQQQQQQQQKSHRIQEIVQNRPSTSISTRPPSTTANTESKFLSIAKSLKTMWDIYQAFSAAWNAIAEHRQKQEQLLRKQIKQNKLQHQQRIRINSKKPPNFNGTFNSSTSSTRNNSNTNSSDKYTSTIQTKRINTSTTKKRKITTKNSQKASKTTTSVPALATTSTVSTISTSRPTIVAIDTQDIATSSDEVTSSLREKRQMNDDDTMTPSQATNVAEGRYIKGDPLKGYYDFVITEGSYKFWAVFQVGTALLIIYSTFAAIYYSKVNPLVSDYDYTDYLGGARSLSGGRDLDFVDDINDDDDGRKSVPITEQLKQRWMEWKPRVGHSLAFILEALDKLPVEHEMMTTTTTTMTIPTENYDNNEYDNDNSRIMETRNTAKYTIDGSNDSDDESLENDSEQYDDGSILR